jgi:hypothetical protein
MHLLKHEFHPSKASRSWDNSIRNTRVEIKILLDEFLSLKNYLKSSEVLQKCYGKSKKYTAAETKLPLKTFPEKCPWTLKELIK